MVDFDPKDLLVAALTVADFPEVRPVLLTAEGLLGALPELLTEVVLLGAEDTLLLTVLL